MKVLVVGGAGYIGSFTVEALKKKDHQPVVFDNLKTGHLQAIPETIFYQGDLQKDKKLLEKIFQKEKPQAVIHLAAYIEVGESVKNPEKYFYNNVYGTLNLLSAMREANIKRIVFSSTAAVYGEPKRVPIKEEDPKNPTNPYGESKLMVEKMLKWYSQAYSFSAVALRYFNAAGASLDGNLGQDYPKPTHLITRACLAALKKVNFAIFGNNYPTKDGTCIRDYIHVLDLAEAHLAALNYLQKKPPGFYAFNVGAGRGYSVLEVVKMVKRVSGIDFPSPIVEPRRGDPAILVADSSKIQKETGWKPKHSDLPTIVESAWKWHSTHPYGYSSP